MWTTCSCALRRPQRAYEHQLHLQTRPMHHLPRHAGCCTIAVIPVHMQHACHTSAHAPLLSYQCTCSMRVIPVHMQHACHTSAHAACVHARMHYRSNCINEALASPPHHLKNHQTAHQQWPAERLGLQSGWACRAVGPAEQLGLQSGWAWLGSLQQFKFPGSTGCMFWVTTGGGNAFCSGLKEALPPLVTYSRAPTHLPTYTHTHTHTHTQMRTCPCEIPSRGLSCCGRCGLQTSLSCCVNI